MRVSFVVHGEMFCGHKSQKMEAISVYLVFSIIYVHNHFFIVDLILSILCDVVTLFESLDLKQPFQNRLDLRYLYERLLVHFKYGLVETSISCETSALKHLSCHSSAQSMHQGVLIYNGG